MGADRTLRVGVDIGGTFTDLVAINPERNELLLAKSPSTPADFSAGVINVLNEVSDDFNQIQIFIHGTTAPLNAFLERKGARTALLTTKGFGDVYVIRRGNRVRMYDLQYTNPEPLVPRSLTCEIEERLDAKGNVLVPLVEKDLFRVLTELRARKVESVAICFINSYINPIHEQSAADFLRRNAPEIFVAPSYEICREWREFERTSTVVLNAYIAPVLKKYLDKLAASLNEKGFNRKIFLMQSNGGLISADEAQSKALLSLMSGPIGASVGAKVLSRRIDKPNLICIDMGGTSFEVSLVIDGKEAVVSEAEFEGFPALTPMVDIHSIGAGGGSMAWSEAGALHVGPKSAGAEPGPACYGMGGEEATVTDANVVLGRIDPDNFLGGSMRLDAELSRSVVAGIAKSFDMSMDQMAEGILAVVNSKMANAIRTMTISKGIDPRGFALIANGGAGPMHAVFIARELGIKTVIVPEVAGAFSAWGMLRSDIRHDVSKSFNSGFDDINWNKVLRGFVELEKELESLMREEDVEREQMRFYRYLEIRYVGQEYFVSVPILQDTTPDVQHAERFKQDFHELYQHTYGHSNPDEKVELANIRVEARGEIAVHQEAQRPELAADPGRMQSSRIRPVYFDGRRRDTEFIHRTALDTEQHIRGPVVIVEKSCTTVVPPGYTVQPDRFRNLVIEKQKASTTV